MQLDRIWGVLWNRINIRRLKPCKSNPPRYRPSNFSSFRNLVLTSVGSSVEALGVASVDFSLPLAAGGLPSNGLESAAIGFDFSPAGVPTRVEASDSSSITKADSNSAGSGPLPSISSSSFSLGLREFLEGDSFAGRLEVEDVEADLWTVELVAFSRAFSSSMRLSIWALSLFEIRQLIYLQGCDPYSRINIPGTFFPHMAGERLFTFMDY